MPEVAETLSECNKASAPALGASAEAVSAVVD